MHLCSKLVSLAFSISFSCMCTDDGRWRGAEVRRCGNAEMWRCGKHAEREMNISSRSGWSRFPFNVAFRTHFDIKANTVLQPIVHNQMPLGVRCGGVGEVRNSDPPYRPIKRCINTVFIVTVNNNGCDPLPLVGQVNFTYSGADCRRVGQSHD